MPRRIDLGRAVLFAGAALLLISLFTRWYDTDLTGWEVFESLDLVLAALAVAGMVAAVRPDAAPPWAAGAVPGAAVLIVFVQLVNVPPAAAGASPSSGAWIALAGALLMAGGAALSLAAISVTVQVREREVRRRVAAVDRRDARDDEDAAALDADAGEPTAASRAPSLFAGLGTSRHDPAEAEAEADDAAPPARRTGRFDQRPPAPAPVTSGSDPAPALAQPEGDLERTQPMVGLPGDEEDAERS